MAIEVADSGAGIAPDELPLIFDRFYQVRNRRSRKKGGSRSRALHRAHDRRGPRRQHHRREQLGEGTRMTIRLPLSPPPDLDGQPTALASHGAADTIRLNGRAAGCTFWQRSRKLMIHLHQMASPPKPGQAADRYPFSVPAVASLRNAIGFDASVTFLVGENGSGKSAILEGLACAAGSIAIAGDDPRRDPTLAAARTLGNRLRLSWRARTQRGFFLRAEDFFGFAKYISALRAGLEDDLAGLEAEPGPERSDAVWPAEPTSRRSARCSRPTAPSTRPPMAKAFWNYFSGGSCRGVCTFSTSRKPRSRRCDNWRCWHCCARW